MSNSQNHSVKLTLVTGAELYTPEYQGVGSLLVAGRSILAVGTPDKIGLTGDSWDVDVVDASGLLLTPGFIDPHQHIIGAGGESGFGSRVHEAEVQDSVQTGTTTVVGLLGTDTATRHLTCLMAKARELTQAGMTALVFTGGYAFPPKTFTGSVTSDLVVIDNVIGVGEIAISDFRSSHPSVRDLAKLVSETAIGGSLSGKAGVTHFHVGEGKARLAILVDLLEDYPVEPGHIYPTHVNRNEGLLDEAVALARRGSFVDLDTTDGHFEHWLRYYIEQRGPLDRVTVSTDSYSSAGNPEDLFSAFRRCARQRILPLHDLLRVFSTNAATVLKLGMKGRLRPGADADFIVMQPETFDVVHVFASGRQMVRDGLYQDETSQTDSSKELDVEDRQPIPA